MTADHPIRAEWIILADAASVVGNKLYLLGGGWDRLVVNTPLPVRQPCAIAVSFRVPWAETNARHQFSLEVQDEDGNPLLRAGGHFEVGRPAGAPAGQPQRFQFAITAPLELKRTGTYVIVARIENDEVDRTTFSVDLGPALLMQPLFKPGDQGPL